jgi:signal transduction histidine kinase
VTALQQRALALQSEIERRKQLEIGLRLSLAEQRQAQAELQASQRHLARLNHDLSHAAQLTALLAGTLASGRARVVQEADLGDLCRRAIASLDVMGPVPRVALTTSGDLRGRWDGERIVCLVGLLVSHALTQGPGGAPILVRADGTRPADVALEVQHRGAIPDDALSELLELQPRHPGGAGLGLQLCRTIAQAHGAALEVSSSETGGTRFAARLPRTPAEDASSLLH